MDAKCSMNLFSKSDVLLQKDYNHHYHMRIEKIFMIAFGAWPATFKGFSLRLYHAYQKISFAYYIFYVITVAVKSIMSLRDGLMPFASTVAVAISYTIGIFKINIFKSRRFINILRETDQREQQVLSSDDEHIIKIFKKNVIYTRKGELLYMLVGTLGAIFYFGNPLVLDIISVRNETVIEDRPLIVDSWFPFDKNKHFYTAYVMQFIGSFYGTGFIVQGHAFYTAMLTFVVGQIKILQYTFINLNNLANRYAKENNISKEAALTHIMKLFIIDHQKLIHLVSEINDCMNLINLFDFCISSFHLSMIGYQTLKVSGIYRFPVLFFFMTQCIQLFLLYWNGNEIFVLSEKLAISIYQSNWNDFPKNVGDMMRLLMLRAQKPLVLHIGPIGEVKLDALFQITKALYSYLCLFAKI